MMEENFFKDVQIVTVSPNEAATDLVFIDDDEDEPRSAGIATIKIALADEEPKRSSTPYIAENDFENPMSIKVTPMDVDKEVTDDNKTADIGECDSTCVINGDFSTVVKIEKDTDCSIEEQEQFEIVEEQQERDSSSSSNDSTRVNKSNESNDHSYSQPLQSNNTFSDDIVKSILQESNLFNNQNVYKMLKEYTKFFENFICVDSQDSQLALYIQQVLGSLEKTEKELCVDHVVETASGETVTKENFHENLAERTEAQASTCNTDSVEQESNSVVMEDSIDISVKSDIIQVKQEIMETDTGSAVKENLNESVENQIQDKKDIDQEAEKLKVYVKKAQDKIAEFNEENQKLLESVFVAEEDIENGNLKFKSSLYNFISFNVALLMDVENKNHEHTSVDEKVSNFIKDEISKKRRRSFRKSVSLEDDVATRTKKESGDTEEVVKSRRESTSSLDKDLSESDSDSSINRLTNLKNLEKSKKYEKSQVSQENKQKKSENAITKKKKEKVDAETSLDSDLSTESESEDVGKDEIEADQDENVTSDDEELKLKHKLEMRARDNLLASSDEESESYVTSETSDFESDDERNIKKKLRDKNNRKSLKDTLGSYEEDNTDSEPDLKEPKNDKDQLAKKEDIKVSSQPEISPTKMDTDDVASQSSQPRESQSPVIKDEKKAKKRQRSSFEREVFNKSLLADSQTDESESENDTKDPNPTKKPRKDSINKSKESINDSLSQGNDIVDLTQPINIKADRKAPTLEKYLEKLNNNKHELDLTNRDVPSTSGIKTNDSPKKKPPSPALDDIDCISISSESDSEISSVVSEGQTTRRRKQLTEEELKEETKKAKKDEAERVKKLELKEQRMTQYITQRLSQNDVIAADELVLDYSEEKDLAVVVHENLVGRLKEHQVDGIKFMYNNCYGSIDEAKENNGSGCILAHCMGLGKTLQLIALLHTVIRYSELYTKRILIICPKSTIHNWAEEFRKWLGCVENRPAVYYLEDNLKIDKRIEKLREWYECKKPSVFLINYESFRVLAHWSGSHKRSKILINEEDVKRYKQQISKFLLDPGPNLVVCDEGHIIKNQKGATNRAITKVKTKRRIILTGTPVQNALHEYYAMVEWIKPNILGTIHEFNNIYANPIKDGQNKDSTDHQIKKMKQKSYVLNKNLSRFVQRKDAQVLKEFLPKKYEYCISVPLTKVQENLYNTFLQANRNGEMGRNLLPIYTGLRKIWTHPVVLQYAYERAKRGEHKFGVQKDAQQKEKKSKDAFNEDDEEPDDIFDTSQGATAVTNNWWNKLVTEQDLKSLNSSHKMMLLFEILRLCELKKEKILIFSSFVAVLDIIERFMKAIHNQDLNPVEAKLYGLDKYRSTWELGKDYFRLDGSTPRNVRSEMINTFNNSPSPRLRCFLISAKAGGQGINLVAANRCIIVDTSWNPANDNQNIFRIFRLGQKKTCYVYRLVACSTMEERVYSRSVTKEAMSHRVVEKKQIDRHYVRTELEELFVPYELKPQEKTPNFPDDDILRYLLHALPKSAYNFHEHDSLLENKPEQELNEDEKNEAWNSYLQELQGNRTQLQNMNNSMTANATLATFGNRPISNDFLKLYQDMIGSSTAYSSLTSMLPSTSSLAGLDQLGLSTSYFPMSSNFYSHDFLKRFGSYDPLSSLYTATSLPNSSTIHSTSTTSPLMQSLRNSHNPISALVNMTGAPSTSTSTSSYSANNIPPASNSIFAQPSTSISTPMTVSSQSPYIAPSTLQNKKVPKKKKPEVKNASLDLATIIKDKTKFLHANNTQLIPTNLSRSLGKNPIITLPNSSENVSILPDLEHSPPVNLSKSAAGTSARTHQVLSKNALTIKQKQNVIDTNARSLIRPNVTVSQSNGSKAIVVTKKTSQNPVITKPQSSVIQKGPIVSPSVLSQPPKNGNSSMKLKKLPSGQIPYNQNKSNMAFSKIPSKLVAARALSPTVNRPVNIQAQRPIINIGPTTANGTDSVSIFRLPAKTQVNKSTVAPVSPSVQATKPVPKVPANVAKILQQQQKKIIDNQTNTTLKRMKFDSQPLSQNSQQLTSPRPVIQQVTSLRSPIPAFSNLSQNPTSSQRAIGQQNMNIIQTNSSRSSKSSQQQSNNSKNSSQVVPEVVEVD